MDDETQSVRIENSASCFGCLTCVEFCRATAIIMTLDKKAAVDLPDLYPTRPANKII
jgi:Fe-S-cluster-containing hydrogenase component 2